MALLYRAGVRRVEIEIESLHTGILRLTGKGVTALQNLQMLKWCAEFGISPNWYLLYGCPGESKEQYEQMLSTMRLVTHLPPPVALIRVGLERLSPYFRDPGRWGIDSIAPKWLYRYIYPETSVRLEEIAYFFDFSWPAARENAPNRYIQPVQRLVSDWQAGYRGVAGTLRSRRGPGFIELLDSRPLDHTAPAQPRRVLLTGVKRAVYTCCESGRPLREIVAQARLDGGGSPTEDEVRRAIQELVADRLLYGENDNYLSLAVPAG